MFQFIVVRPKQFSTFLHDTWPCSIVPSTTYLPSTGLSRCTSDCCTLHIQASISAVVVVGVRRVVDVYSQAITTSATACYLPENTRERHNPLHALARRITVPRRHRQQERDAGVICDACRLQLANWTMARDRRLHPNYGRIPQLSTRHSLANLPPTRRSDCVDLRRRRKVCIVKPLCQIHHACLLIIKQYIGPACCVPRLNGKFIVY